MLKNLSLKLQTLWFSFEEKQRGKKMPWWGWAIAVPLLVAAIYLPRHMIIATTGSTNDSVFWKDETVLKKDAIPGAYFTFERVHPWVDRVSTVLFVKRIGCGPGQSLRRTYENDFWCDKPNGNKSYLGRALTEDSKGTPIPVMEFQGEIPPDKFFMMGDSARSYDSKSYGLVDFSEFKHHAIPIF